MSGKHVLSIDQGTTGTTVLIFDCKGEVRSRAYSEFTQYYPRPGWVEHDATEIWQVSIGVIAEALKTGHIRASDLDAIGITNQRETVVLWERASGKPVGKAIVWQDRRTAAYCGQLRAREGLEEKIRAKTGLVIDPYFSGTKIKWLLDNVNGLRRRAEKGEIAFGTIDSWLVWKLTGGRAHITDYSNASRTLLYNIHDLRWDQEILEILDIPPLVLPEVKPSSFIYGETDPEMFFGTHSIPIAGIAGDQQAALFGQACHRPGRVKNTYGTGSFILMNTGNAAIRSREKLLTTIAWGSATRLSNTRWRAPFSSPARLSSGCVTVLGSSRRQRRPNPWLDRSHRTKAFISCRHSSASEHPIGTHTHAAFSPGLPAVRPALTSLEPFLKASLTRRGMWSR